MIAKKGDILCLKHRFYINSFSLEREVIDITYINSDDTPLGGEIVPLYLSELGIYPKEIAFVMPGDHNDFGHPDYYPITHISDRGKRVIYNDKPHQLRLDPDFRYNGKYSLVHEATGTTYTVRARKTTNKFIEDTLVESSKHMLNGKLIKGVVVTFYYKNEDASITFVSSMDISMNGSFYRTAYVYIRDLYTNVEYDLPVHLMTLA